MPTTVRWPVRVSRGVSVYDRFRKEKKGALGLHFEMEKGDTVYAMRRGTVVEVGIPERDPDARRVLPPKAPICWSSSPMARWPGISASTATMCWSRSGTKCCQERRWRWPGAMTASDTKFSVQTFWWEIIGPEGRERKTFIRKHFFPQFVTGEGVVCVEKGVYRPVETEEW